MKFLYKHIKAINVAAILAMVICAAIAVGTLKGAADYRREYKIPVPELSLSVGTAGAVDDSEVEADTVSGRFIVASGLSVLASDIPGRLPADFETEVVTVARMLSGEEYDHETDNKRKIAEIACNRVSAGLSATIVEAVEEPLQFAGYWNPSRGISPSDISVAYDVLTEWYEGGKQAFGDELFFDHIDGVFVTAATYAEFEKLVGSR
ncbi:MAG: hypothetical protein LBT88_06645 [Oscillospiraceae bacterium]|jgi:hypothetical protein|nr:hypothetical protein [Oscillospiraceae bacterium]